MFLRLDAQHHLLIELLCELVYLPNATPALSRAHLGELEVRPCLSPSFAQRLSVASMPNLIWPLLWVAGGVRERGR